MVAFREAPGAIGQSFDQGNSTLSQYLLLIQCGKDEVLASDDAFKAFSPIIIGRTKTPRSVMIDVPGAVAMAEATKLDQDLLAEGPRDGVSQLRQMGARWRRRHGATRYGLNPAGFPSA